MIFKYQHQNGLSSNRTRTKNPTEINPEMTTRAEYAFSADSKSGTAVLLSQPLNHLAAVIHLAVYIV